MDRITLKNLNFYGYHGLLKEENNLGQRFYVDIELFLDLKPAGQKDDINLTVNYADIYAITKKHFTDKQYKLLETLAENISQDVLNYSKLIQEVLIRIRKPNAPVNGHFDYFEVEIRRKNIMDRAFLGLGSNMGDRKKYLLQALAHLEENNNIKIIKKSSIYETEPVGFKEQNLFLNMVIKINTDLRPWELLDYCQKIENLLGRERTVKWGPRTIDIDILIYEGFEMTTKKLTLPHPRMQERAFVLIPLKEIAPETIINNQKINELISEIDTTGVRTFN